MKLHLNNKLAENYKSPSQITRILTEHWVDKYIFCPNCGNFNIDKYPNNQPVADFFCSNCKEDYELKSKKTNIGTKVVDGAYQTMIKRLQSNNNPNFFLLSYNLQNYKVQNFLVIPKHFFIPEMIEKRKPLALTARRAGWIGCNILLKSIPEAGKIFFVKDSKIELKEKVLVKWRKTFFLQNEIEIKAKGWLLDIMKCIDSIRKKDFSLAEIYSFENELSIKYPKNHHVKDKIRQQLQVLRDKGYLEFSNRGNYKLK